MRNAPHPPTVASGFGLAVAKGVLDLLLQVLEPGQSGFGILFRYRDLPGVSFGVLDEFETNGIFA